MTPSDDFHESGMAATLIVFGLFIEAIYQ